MSLTLSSDVLSYTLHKSRPSHTSGLFIYSRGSNVKKNISKIFSKSKKGTFLGDFKLLLKKMLDLNYKKRIEPPDAYIEFNRILNKEYPKSISLVKTKKKQKRKKRSKAKRSKAKRSKAK